MVGGEREHDRLGIALQRELGAGGDGRRGIAPHRLEHDGRVDADLLGLPAGKEPELGRGHHDRRREQVAVSHPASAC